MCRCVHHHIAVGEESHYVNVCFIISHPLSRLYQTRPISDVFQLTIYDAVLIEDMVVYNILAGIAS